MTTTVTTKVSTVDETTEAGTIDWLTLADEVFPADAL
nr:hypothetical protein CPGR_04158 [Mycolicibacterium malmesburyense]